MRDFDDPFSTAGDMKYHLQNLLDSKEKQLQQAGSLGQRVLAQQMELEERIRQLQVLEADKGEDDEIDLGARERYRELAETILSWDTENAQLSSAFGGGSKVRCDVAHNMGFWMFYYSAFLTAVLIRPTCHLATCPVRNQTGQRFLLAHPLHSPDVQRMRPIVLMMSVSSSP
jgi:hypothetical protein